jgi:hypothetical protein
MKELDLCGQKLHACCISTLTIAVSTSFRSPQFEYLTSLGLYLDYLILSISYGALNVCMHKFKDSYSPKYHVVGVSIF